MGSNTPSTTGITRRRPAARSRVTSRGRWTTRRVGAVLAALLVMALVVTTGWAYLSGYVDAPWRRPLITSVAVEPVAELLAFVA